MNNKVAPMFVAISGLALASCTHTTPTIDKQYNYISPAPNIRLGEVYVSDERLSEVSRPDLRELCPRDFEKTSALAELRSKYANSTEAAGLDETKSASDSAEAGVTGIRLKLVRFGGTVKPSSTTTSEYSGVTSKTIDIEDMEILRLKVGKKCRKLIADSSKAGFGVFIPTSVYKAKTVKITTEVKKESGVEANISILGPKRGLTLTHETQNSVTVSGQDMYFKLKSGQL